MNRLGTIRKAGEGQDTRYAPSEGKGRSAETIPASNEEPVLGDPELRREDRRINKEALQRAVAGPATASHPDLVRPGED